MQVPTTQPDDVRETASMPADFALESAAARIAERQLRVRTNVFVRTTATLEERSQIGGRGRRSPIAWWCPVGSGHHSGERFAWRW